jgi:outer membrane protein assembly factor BamB
VKDGVVYTLDQDGAIHTYAVGCGTGGEDCAPLGRIWTTNQYGYNTTLWPAFTVADGVVYATSLGEGLFAFPASCGLDNVECAPLWVGAIEGYDATPPTVSDGVVYAGDANGRVYAWTVDCATDGARCDPLWTAQTGGLGFTTATAVANGVVYVGSLDGALYAFAADCTPSRGGACTPLWKGHTSSGFGIAASVAVADGVVFAPGLDGTVYAFDTSCAPNGLTCEPIGTGAMHGELRSPPVVGDGLLYITSGDGNLVAFRLT